MTPARLVKGWSEKLENFTVTNWEQFQACSLLMSYGAFEHLKAIQWKLVSGCYLELKSPR